MQQNRNILNSQTAVIHKKKRNAADNSEKVVHPCIRKKLMAVTDCNKFYYVETDMSLISLQVDICEITSTKTK